MQAVILAGGLGTRLRPLTYTVPKPMVRVAGDASLHLAIEWLVRSGCTEVLVTTGFLAELIEWDLARHPFPIPVRCVREPRALGTAGALKHCESLLRDEFLVVQGDSVTDLDPRRVAVLHRRTGAALTMGVLEVEEVSRYGIVEFQEDGSVLRFLEKPRPEEAFSRWANTGIYCMRRDLLQQLPADQPSDLVFQILLPLLATRGAVRAQPLTGYWVDLGTPDTYLMATAWAMSHVAGGGSQCRDRSVNLQPPVHLGSGVRLAAGVLVGPNTVLGEGCVLGAGARVEEAILYDRVSLGDDCRLTRCILGGGTRLGRGVRVGEYAIVGEGCVLEDGVELKPRAKVGPHCLVPAGTVVHSVISPRLERLEELQATVASYPVFGGLSREELCVVGALSEFGELSARVLAQVTRVAYSRIHPCLYALEQRGLVISQRVRPAVYALRFEDPGSPGYGTGMGVNRGTKGETGDDAHADGDGG